ncbi:MAG TPA: Ig-like domain-containing protein [Terriglobales bacterium]|jgi:uncharacterized protein YjdB|nr:Ig-like domain-containing protein [Terriglobales bacterium]
MAKFLRCFLLVFLAVMTACGGGISNNSTGSTGSHASVVLQSIQVVANNPSFAAGLSQQLTATGSYSDGSTKDLTSTAVWSSSNASVAVVSANGVAKALSPGSSKVTATQANLSGQVSLTVSAPVLTSIVVSSVAPSIAAGLSDQFTATGNYSDGSTQNLSSSVTWSVSNPAVASISNSGLASSKATGAVVITATQGTISGTASLTVGSPSLASITVRSTTSSVGVGFTDQFTATGNYTDGSTQDLTGSVNWSVSNSALVVISSGGLVTAKSNGSATITATAGSITGTAPLTVTISLVSITITPPSPTIAANTSEQFKATGTFTDGSTQDVTGTVNWSSSDTTKATISNSGPTSGLAHALHSGSCTMTASSGAISASDTLIVSNGTLASISVTPAASTIPLGVLQQFTATGTFSDGTTQDITNTVTWSSSQPALAAITVSGAATARNLGTVTILASSGSVNGSTSLTVNAANLMSLSIQPGSVAIAQGTTSKLNAIGLFNDGSTRDVSAQATWSSSNPAAATVQTNGRLQGINPGSTSVTATLGAQSISANVTVTNATVVSISVTPSISSLAPGTQITFVATGQFSDSSAQVISSNVTWASSDTTVATVSNNAGTRGIAATVATGGVNITATFEGVTGTAQLNVSGANLTSIVINPPTAVLAPASTEQYSVTASYDDGTTQIVSTLVAWSSSDTSLATITPFGQATGQSAGLATITAAYGGFSSSADVLVESAALTSITVNPSNLTIPGQIIAGFTAIGTFADGSFQDLTSAVTWTSSAASVATVSNAAGTRGFATAVAPGSSTISAVFAGEVGTAGVAVTNATLASISITPGNPNITLGTSQVFVAIGTFSDGSTMNLSTQVAWSSSDVNVAVINTVGLATSASSGTTTITATLNGVSTTTTLTVN